MTRHKRVIRIIRPIRSPTPRLGETLQGIIIERLMGMEVRGRLIGIEIVSVVRLARGRKLAACLGQRQAALLSFLLQLGLSTRISRVVRVIRVILLLSLLLRLGLEHKGLSGDIRQRQRDCQVRL